MLVGTRPPVSPGVVTHRWGESDVGSADIPSFNSCGSWSQMELNGDRWCPQLCSCGRFMSACESVYSTTEERCTADWSHSWRSKQLLRCFSEQTKLMSKVKVPCTLCGELHHPLQLCPCPRCYQVHPGSYCCNPCAICNRLHDGSCVGCIKNRCLLSICRRRHYVLRQYLPHQQQTIRRSIRSQQRWKEILQFPCSRHCFRIYPLCRQHQNHQRQHRHLLVMNNLSEYFPNFKSITTSNHTPAATNSVSTMPETMPKLRLKRTCICSRCC